MWFTCVKITCAPNALPVSRRTNTRATRLDLFHVKGTMSAGGHAQWSPIQTNLHITRRGIIISLPLRLSCRSHLLTRGAVVESVSHELSLTA